MRKFQIFQDKAPQLDPHLKLQKAFGWDGIVDPKTQLLVSNRYCAGPACSSRSTQESDGSGSMIHPQHRQELLDSGIDE